MASQRQTEANRRNASLSTGPNTPAGKTTVSQNSLTHGLLARDAVMPDEDPRGFLEILTALQAEFQPVGLLEDFLIHQMAASQWRLRRLSRIETGLLTCRLAKTRELEREAQEDYDDDDDEEQDEPEDQDTPPEPPAPEGQPEDYEETTRLLGLSFYRDSAGADIFSKLSRYENMIRRAFYKALSQLESSQARRTGQPPPEKAKITKQRAIMHLTKQKNRCIIESWTS